MAAVNLVRSVFSGILRKPATFRTNVACRLPTVVAQQKYSTVQAAVNLINNHHLRNGVSPISINTMLILGIYSKNMICLPHTLKYNECYCYTDNLLSVLFF